MAPTLFPSVGLVSYSAFFLEERMVPKGFQKGSMRPLGIPRRDAQDSARHRNADIAPCSQGNLVSVATAWQLFI